MKMIIVLDKICLACVVGVSLYVGYKAGEASATLKQACKEIEKTNFNAD